MEVDKSNGKLIFLLIVCIAMAFVGFQLAEGSAVDTRGRLAFFVGWLTLVICGLGSLIFAYRLLLGHRHPVRFSPSGFLDRRLLKEEVPWASFSRLSVWTQTVHLATQSAIQLDLAPEFRDKVELTWYGAYLQRLNRCLGYSDFYVSAADLQLSHDDLLDLMRRYFEEFNPSAIQDNDGKAPANR